MRSRVALLFLATGCTERVDLIDMALWSLSDQDPFEDGPEVVDCPSSSWGVEIIEVPVLEVDTGACNYANLEQPLLERIRKGDTLHLVLGHGDLVADEPSQAHVAVVIDGEVLWQTTEPIPGIQRDYDLWIESDASVAAGAPVLLHLHNHGSNTWNLLELSSGPAPSP